MKRTRLALFEHRTQAESARRSLTEVGIRAEIHAESRFAQLWFVSRSRAGLYVEVPVDEADEAAGFLFHRKGCERWLGSAIRCPECKSFRVDFPQFTEKSIFTNVAMGLMAEVGFVERQYYCENCHFMWVRSGSRAIRIRPHLAPNYFLEDMNSEGQANPTSNNPRRSRSD
jgi:predicted Zn-ribbon and HTH transcriptional regulator